MEEQLINEVVWTRSRYKTLRECKRKYWLRYYGSWEGWNGGIRETDEATRLAYILSKMQNRYLLAGSITHETIAWGLQLKVWDLENLLAKAGRETRRVLRSSQRGLWKSDPKRNPNLEEHYYGRGFREGELRDQITERVETSLVAAHRWIKENATSSSIVFLEKGFKTPTKPPCLGRLDLGLKDRRLRIIDWKTGSPSEEDEEQGVFYALVSILSGEATPRDLEVCFVYLLKGGESNLSWKCLEPRMEDLSRKIDRESKRFLEIHNEPDQLRDQKTKDLWKCRGCFFRQLCDR